MKNNVVYRLIALAMATVMLLTLAACGTNKPADSSSAPHSDVPTTTTTTAPAKKNDLNILTGEYDMTTKNDRPIAFVITDESSSLVQLNLEDADFFFEAETEAGIPRIMAVFSSIDRVPDEIGPVRSARPHFVKMAAAMDAIYCHIGGSYSGLSTITQLGVDDIHGAEQVNSILAASSNFSWNRKTFAKNKVISEINRRKYSLTSDVSAPYQFGEKAGTTTANTVDVKISNSYNMAFTYDTASGLYQKHRNALSTPVHVTHTGGTIEVSNVIVMFDRRFIDPQDATRYDFEMKSGSGILASGGTSREIRWVNDSRGIQYYEADGKTPLTVATGKTFVCLASDTLKNKTKIS
jgi:hypothetical protein